MRHRPRKQPRSSDGSVRCYQEFRRESCDRAFITRRFFSNQYPGRSELLDAAREAMVIRFLQVSTDEVGSLSGRARACEDWPLHPSSAYSAKPPPTCCLAAHCTHGQDVVITRCTNNYARTPRKLIPLMITNALHDRRCRLWRRTATKRLDPRQRPRRGVLAALERGRAVKFAILELIEPTNLSLCARFCILGKSENSSNTSRRPPRPRYAVDTANRAMSWPGHRRWTSPRTGCYRSLVSRKRAVVVETKEPLKFLQKLP